MKKLILFTALFIGLLNFTSCADSAPDETDAKEAARSAVLQNLKNPVDMTFHQNETIKNLGDNTFEYKETINATNSFGGSIKQDVTVQVKWLKDDPSEVSNWSIIDIQFDEI